MKRKFKYFLLIILLLVIGVFVVNFYYNNNKQEVFEENEKKEINKNSIKIPGMVSLMLETKAGSGEYKISSERVLPTSGYEFNSERSGCENGGTLSWNNDTQKLVLKTRISDKCYAYFDVLPPDVSVSITNRPTTYGKLGNINCSGASASFNQKYNRIEISSIDNKYTSCNLNYTDSTSKVNLADYIIGLSGTTQGNGQVVSENGYRYEGKNPNNYIWFNDEYWRIIGVFDSDSHGQSGKSLVKIIRDDSLGGLAWNKSNTNDWTTASLNKLLNGAYYNAQDGTDSGYCYGYESTVTTNCDYTKKGIQSGYRSMVANVTWYLGGNSSEEVTAAAFYNYERGTTVYSGNPTSTTGYIGIMYPSDYGYSVLASSCARTTNLSSSSCVGQSWLYGKGEEWMIISYSSGSHNVFFLNYIASVSNSYNVIYGYATRPVLYLDASVYKLDGDGSLNSPYMIGI